MDWTSASIVISAIATSVIAIYSIMSYKLAKEITKQDKSYRDSLENLTKNNQNELSDLYQAIVIATLMGGSGNTGVVKTLIDTFSEHYKGNIEIFKKVKKSG
jgi:hypothetical protein